MYAPNGFANVARHHDEDSLSHAKRARDEADQDIVWAEQQERIRKGVEPLYVRSQKIWQSANKRLMDEELQAKLRLSLATKGASSNTDFDLAMKRYETEIKQAESEYDTMMLLIPEWRLIRKQARDGF